MEYETEEVEEIEDSDENEVSGDLNIQRILLAGLQGRNIVDFLDEEKQSKCVSTLVSTFERDKLSLSEWLEDYKKWMKMALQVKEMKNFPWPGAANVKFPMITVAVIQFASRIGPAVVKKPYPVNARINGHKLDGKVQKADRISKHMSWQITDQMPTWQDDHDTLLCVLPIAGCAFKKIYRDTANNRNAAELVMPDRVVFDYYAKSIEDARTVTHWYYLHPQEIIKFQRMGIWAEGDVYGCGPVDDDFETRDAVNNTDASADNDSKGLVRILEQHGWADLDGDGFEEPYIFTVAEESRKLLRVEPRFMVDSVMVNNEGEVVDIKAENYFVQYTFLPDPSGGNRGLGWGRMLGPISDTVNTIINQNIDLGTSNNMGGGLIDKSFKIEGGEVKRAPGQYIRVNANAQTIANGVMPWPSHEPSQVLFQLLTLLIGWGQRITAVTDQMSGELPAANVPATTTLAMLEQGQKVFQGIYARIYRAMEKEFKHLFRLNKLYMPEQEYYRVLDETAQVYAMDYQGDDTDVTLTAEQTLPSEQIAMTRLRVVMEAANSGVKVNPEYISKLFITALGLPETEAQNILMPEAPSDAVRIKQMELEAKMAQDQQRNELEAARIQTENKRIDVDSATKSAQLMLQHREGAVKAAMEVEKMDMEEEKMMNNGKV